MFTSERVCRDAFRGFERACLEDPRKIRLLHVGDGVASDLDGNTVLVYPELFGSVLPVWVVMVIRDSKIISDEMFVVGRGRLDWLRFGNRISRFFGKLHESLLAQGMVKEHQAMSS